MAMSETVKNRLLSVVLAGVILFTSLLGLGVGVPSAYAADANDRIQTALNLGSGKQIGGLDGEGLTEEELRFYGIFMSNLYVPFVTEIGPQSVQSQTSVDAEALQEEFVRVAQENLNMDEDTAKAVSKAVLNQVRQGQKLKLGVSDKQPTPEQQNVTIKELETEATWLNLMALIMGYGKHDIHPEGRGGNFDGMPESLQTKYSNLGEGSRKDVETLANSKYNFGYLYYEEGGEKKIVFDFDLYAEKTTPSVVSLMMILNGGNLSKGYGKYLFDAHAEEELNNDVDAIASWVKENAYEASIANTPLFVSPFGDITVAGGNHKYVVMPGATNPYTWIDLNNKNIVGYSLPMQTLYGASYIDAGRTGELYTSTNTVGVFLTTGGRYDSLRGEMDARTALSVMHGTSETEFDRSGYWNPFASNDAGLGAYSYAAEKVFESKPNFLQVSGNSNASSGGAIAPLAESSFYTKGKKGAFAPIFMLPNANHTKHNPDGSTESFTAQDLMNSGTEAGVFDKIMYVDDLGQSYWGDTENDVDFTAFNAQQYKGEAGGTNIDSTQDMSAYLSTLTSARKNLIETPKTGHDMLTYLYISYVFAAFSNNAGEDTSGLGYAIAVDNLPKMSDKALSFDGENSDEALEAIKGWVYYLLHPVEGIEYVATLLDNKIGGFFIHVTEEILGTQGTGLLSGSSKYLGIGGYVSTPEFADITFFNNVVGLYNDNVLYVILFFLVIITAYAISGMISWGKAVAGILVFGVAATLPANLISEGVSWSNSITNWMYGGKFQFWSLTQHQAYAAKIDEAIEGTSDEGAGGYENYLRTLMSTRGDAKNLGGENISVRWQAPKKMASLQVSQEDKNKLNDSGLKMLTGAGGMVENTFSGESFLDNPEALYMYRSYIDLANFSRFTYAGISGISTNDFPRYSGSLPSSVMSNWDEGLRDSWNERNDVAANDLEMGYTNPNKDGSAKVDDTLAGYLPVTSKIINDHFSDIDKISDLQYGEYVGTDSNMWNFSLPMFGNTVKGDFIGEMVPIEGEYDASVGGKYNNSDYTGLAAYGLMSESPYFYYSWNLYDQGLDPSPGATGGYKDLLLGSGDVEEDYKGSAYFYNMSNDGQANGELKDYQNMRALFTYVIPYLNQANDVVRAWDNVYGFKLHEGVPFEEGQEELVLSMDKNGDLVQKYWHNVNVNRLYNLYSPWVDLMYSADYAQPEKIDVAGETVTITDPINPASYPDERPMIFSRSEMEDYGLNMDQLTEVERRILDVEDSNIDSMINLMNYYNFNDSVINAAVAMESTFNFNRIFSDKSVFGEDYLLYPQNYEIKNFTFDAFLRLILANNMGGTERITQSPEESFYQAINDETNLFGSIILLVVSIISTYVIPLLKTLFPFVLFLTTMVMIWAAVVQIIENNVLKNLFKSLVKPLIMFTIIVLIHAWVITLLMGDGNTSVTGDPDGFILSFDNPIWALMLLLVINLVVTWLIFKQLKVVWKDLKTYGVAAIQGVGAALSGVMGKVAGAINSKVGGTSTGTGSGTGSGSAGAGGGTTTGVIESSGSLKSRKESMSRRGGSMRVKVKSYVPREDRASARVSRAGKRAWDKTNFAQEREGYKSAKYNANLEKGKRKYEEKQEEKAQKKKEKQSEA